MTVHTRSLKEIAIMNKDLVLGDPPPPRWSKTILSRFLIFGPFPYLECLLYFDPLHTTPRPQTANFDVGLSYYPPSLG